MNNSLFTEIVDWFDRVGAICSKVPNQELWVKEIKLSDNNYLLINHNRKVYLKVCSLGKEIGVELFPTLDYRNEFTALKTLMNEEKE